jgi:hypothetical protein
MTIGRAGHNSCGALQHRAALIFFHHRLWQSAIAIRRPGILSFPKLVLRMTDEKFSVTQVFANVLSNLAIALETPQLYSDFHMATPAQILANRQNAERSHGPVTAQGKTRVSQNATKFGLFSVANFVRPEEQNIFDEFQTGYLAELAPDSSLEQTLAREIIQAAWRLRRCANLEVAPPEDLADEELDRLQISKGTPSPAGRACLRNVCRRARPPKTIGGPRSKRTGRWGAVVRNTAKQFCKTKPTSAGPCARDPAQRPLPLQIRREPGTKPYRPGLIPGTGLFPVMPLVGVAAAKMPLRCSPRDEPHSLRDQKR